MIAACVPIESKRCDKSMKNLYSKEKKVIKCDL